MAAIRSKERITPEFRGSYLHLFTPEVKSDGTQGAYSVTALFPKKSENWIQDLPWLAEMIKEVLAQKYPNGAGMPPIFASGAFGKHIPVKDGDAPNTLGNVNADHKGHWVVRMSTYRFNPAINLLNKETNTLGGLDEGSCYSGCYLLAKGVCYFRDNDGVGVSFAFNNLAMTRKGEPLGGKVEDAGAAFGVEAASAADAFAVASTPAAPSADPLSPAPAAAPVPSATGSDPLFPASPTPPMGGRVEPSPISTGGLF